MLVSAAFWTLLWGVVGLVLCGPLTVCLVVLGKHSPQLRFFALLLGNEPVLESNLSFYQRLLAHDHDEAWQLVNTAISKRPLRDVLDELLLPAITYAKRDYDRDLLDKAEEELIFRCIRDIFSDFSEMGGVQESSAVRERIKVLACAARDQGDVLALEMLRSVVDGAQWDLQIVPPGTLSSELLTLLKGEAAPIVCIAALPPGGLAQARYLCKRLRTRYPHLKIVVGRWGLESNVDGNRKQLVEAGANEVGVTLDETISQLNGWLPVLAEDQRRPMSA